MLSDEFVEFLPVCVRYIFILVPLNRTAFILFIWSMSYILYIYCASVWRFGYKRHKCVWTMFMYIRFRDFFFSLIYLWSLTLSSVTQFVHLSSLDFFRFIIWISFFFDFLFFLNSFVTYGYCHPCFIDFISFFAQFLFVKISINEN